MVIVPLEYGCKLQESDDDEVMKPNIMTISLSEVYQDRANVESVQESMYAFFVRTIYNVVSIATAKLKHAKILRTNTFYVDILC